MREARPDSELLEFIERGSGPPLLLLHGLMVSGEMFAPVLPPLARRHRVIVPDLRGHGRSRALPPPFTVARIAADLTRLLDHLGIGASAVLGYSQGGAVAQQLAFDHPERCDRLVLACTYAYNMTSLREKVEAHLAPLLIRALGMPRFARLVVSQGARDLGEERGDWLVALMASQDRARMLLAWKDAMAYDGRPRLREITCPTLVVAGSNDQAVPMHHAKVLQEGIRASRLVVVEGAGHALIWTHPEELVRVTEQFLAS
jgi:3-oxoadipate enol-lactonase